MTLRRPLARCAAAVVGALAITASLAASPAAAAPKPGSVPDSSITVMTRNVYLGGDIGAPLRAVEAALRAGARPEQAFEAFVAANSQLFGTVFATNFPARSALLAREIADRDVDVVGLQEVAHWRMDDTADLPGTAGFGVPEASGTVFDFLAILQAQLNALGEPYVAVEVQDQSDVEAPAFIPSLGGLRDVRLTMRDVLLKRVDSDVQVLDSGSGQYAARLPVELAGGRFDFVRGYNWADLRSGAKRLRVVNTHFESQFSFIADMQARELLAGPADARGRAVALLCDCNSDPLDGSTKPGDVPHWTAYRTLTGEGGFSDAWLLAGTGDGSTSGFSETVDDPTTAPIDHRIDLVLVRGPGRSPVAVDSIEVTGLTARTPGGLWASDHAGVVSTIRP